MILKPVLDPSRHLERGVAMAVGYLLLLLIVGCSALEKCLNDTNAFLQELNQDHPEDFAVVMYDSFGKPGSNILGGTVNQPGLMSECRSVHTASFSGHYCKAYMTQGDVFYFVGICVPDSCSDKDVHTLLLGGRLKFGEISLIPPLPAVVVNASTQEVVSVDCLPNTVHPGASGIASLVICCVVVALPLVATLITAVRTCQDSKERAPLDEPFSSDERKMSGNCRTTDSLECGENNLQEDCPNKKRQKSFLSRCLRQYLEAFSLQKTTQGVLSAPASVKGSYPSLNAIRALSMLWIALGHAMQMTTFISGSKKSISLETNVLHVLTIGGAIFLAVDTFLLLGGMLSAKSLLSSIQRNEDSMSPGLVAEYYFKRIKRVQPLHMFLLVLAVAIGALFPEGPYQFTSSFTLCDKAWWAKMLLINNFLGQCIGWTWYLSLDFQCYATTPLLILAYRKNKGVFTVLVVALLLMNLLSGSISTALLHLPVFSSDAIMNTDYGVFYYTKPHTRCGPFLIGILFGMYLKIRKTNLLKKTWQAALGWMCSLSLLALVVGLSYALKDVPDYPSATHAIYQGLHRTVWATALAWVILACEEGFGGYIMNFLSLKFWVPLSNLSFACYLFHPIIIAIHLSMQETTIQYSDFNYIYLFFGHVVCTVVLSYAATVLVEKPFILLKWKRKI